MSPRRIRALAGRPGRLEAGKGTAAARGQQRPVLALGARQPTPEELDPALGIRFGQGSGARRTPRSSAPP